MKTIALLLGLCGGVVMQPAPNVEPWPKVSAEGYVRSYEGFVLFGTGNKRLYLDNAEGHFNLSFATQADYEQAEKLLGQLVAAEGYLVAHGYEQRFVPVALRERVK